MSHDSYEHERRQTAALERIAELLENMTPALTGAGRSAAELMRNQISVAEPINECPPPWWYRADSPHIEHPHDSHTGNCLPDADGAA